MKTTLIVDDLAENFAKQPKNGVRISPWMGSTADTSLQTLTEWLVGLSTEYPNDIRKISKQIF